ncbi:N-acetyltransferase [Curtobacterium sp. MCBA15_012]|uniref:GNAT family N-acetyltransferase n=1 Tax=Curtobacterium sp. MCBA15_012 TaxID=1898738 RepID=UPI0008DCFCA5|nr:N-acetyltransferase [Curtobacterium sp. MCBA15_012]WIA99259.1 N-acetyltransferase [Curtobacterium sp. MCBA15_012]
MIGSSFVVRTADDQTTAVACIELWVAAVAARDGQPPSDAVRERARDKFAADRVALVVADAGPRPDGTRDGTAPVAGFALVSAPGTGGGPASDAAYLSLLAVAPHAQGHGLGRRLLAAAVEAAAAAGHDRCELHALDDNAPAVALYRSAGFAPVGPPFPHPLSGRPTRVWRTGPEPVR